jgi:hypothetical protein
VETMLYAVSTWLFRRCINARSKSCFFVAMYGVELSFIL